MDNINLPTNKEGKYIIPLIESGEYDECDLMNVDAYKNTSIQEYFKEKRKAQSNAIDKCAGFHCGYHYGLAVAKICFDLDDELKFYDCAKECGYNEKVSRTGLVCSTCTSLQKREVRISGIKTRIQGILNGCQKFTDQLQKMFEQ
jgi:hypothetical protein